MYKRIITLVIAISMLFVLGAAPAYADIGDASAYSTKCFWNWVTDIFSGGGWSSAEWWHQLVSSGDPATSYTTAVSALPASTIGSDGAVYWQPTFNQMGGGNWAKLTVRILSNNNLTYYDVNNQSYSNASLGDYIKVNATASTTSIFDVRYNITLNNYCLNAFNNFGSSNCKVPITGVYYFTGNAVTYQGLTASYQAQSISCTANSYYNLTGTYNLNCSSVGYLAESHVYFYTPIFKIVPSQAIDFSTDTNYNRNTRVNNNTFNIATAADGTGTYKAGVQFVDESTNKYYSAENNAYYDMSSWKYNYTTRTYDITLADNSVVSVAFSDDFIKVIEQGTEHDYYYAEAITPTPTPAPTPAPDPTDSNGWWAWLKTWLTDFKTWLGTEFDNLGIGDKDTTITNNDYDYSVTYNENGESKSFSFSRFKGKIPLAQGYLHNRFYVNVGCFRGQRFSFSV